MKRSGRFTAAAITVALALTVVGCAASTSEPSDDVIRIARAADVTTLNADAVASSKEGWETLQLIADSLFAIDAEGVLQPRIADSYEFTDDNKTLTITLKEGVTFSDGSPVTAADVVFTLDNAKKGELLGGVFAAITSAEAPDDKTVVLHYEVASSAAILALAGYGAAVIPKDFGGKTADEFWQDPVTVGAYKIDSWEQGVGITLVRSESYFGTPGKIETIEFVTVPDSNTRLLQLQNGSVDIIDAVSTAQADQITETEGLSVTEFASGQNIFLTMNSTGEPFSSEAARRAVSLGIDREKVVEAALGGHGAPGASFIVPAALGGFAPEFGSRYDVAAAKRELAAAGLPDGFSFEIMYASGDPTIDTAMQIVQASLAEIGITATLAGLENDALGVKVEANDWDAYVANIISDTDAGEVLQYYAPTNGFYSGDQDMMATIQKYFEEANADFSGQDGRNAIFAKAVTDVAESGLQVAIYDPSRLWGSSSKVGTVYAVRGALDFTKLTISE